MSRSPRPLLDAINAEEDVEPIARTGKGPPSETGVSFGYVPDGPGIEIVDPVERHRYTLLMDADVSPTPTGTEKFLFSVDAAVGVTTDAITLPTTVPVCVRDTDGTFISKTEHHADQELTPDTYSIELLAPIRLYLRVESALQIVSDADQVRIEFGDETVVGIGARSHRKPPAGTITTTDDPEDLMAAVSTFGSALDTTSPERSYPSFRGHPPLIERGDELDVPEEVAPPDTGLRIEVPAEYRTIYAVAPLAYYLGARVVPGEVPRLVADTGFEHRLDATLATGIEDGDDGKDSPDDEFETEVAHVLKQTFLLDCVTRTEGLYPVELREHNELEDVLDVDFADLYDRPLVERVETHLGVPYETVEPHLPDWKLTTHIEPTPERAESLPFAANDLAIVRTPRSGEPSVSEECAATIKRQTKTVDEFVRSPLKSDIIESAVDEHVNLPADGSLRSVWIGDGRPLSGGKTTLDAYRNRLDREPTDGTIHVTVVCNDIDRTGRGRTGMADEHATVDEMYGGKLSLPFDVTVHHDLTTNELSGVLAADTDFFHYVGHIDECGFECIDGILDANSLDSVGADAFFLNACRSYEQGMALLDAGAIGGIVTSVNVVNGGAIPLGKAITRLLNDGFPLSAALEVARSEMVAGARYHVVGSQGMAITQSESGTPTVCNLTQKGNTFELELESYPTTQQGMGTMVMPYIKQNDEYFLSSGHIESFDVSQEELSNFLDQADGPVRADGALHWPHTVDQKYVKINDSGTHSGYGCSGSWFPISSV